MVAIIKCFYPVQLLQSASSIEFLQYTVLTLFFSMCRFYSVQSARVLCVKILSPQLTCSCLRERQTDGQFIRIGTLSQGVRSDRYIEVQL